MTGHVGVPSSYGLWAMGGTTAFLAVFFLLRGRVRIESGWAGFTIARFAGVERFGHWLLALSFVVLALTGLNMQYGRYVLAPIVGDQAFAEIMRVGKVLHATVAFAFMASLLLMFFLWIGRSLPHWRDVVWLLKGGGMIVRGSHPPAWKFNAGQKILFWLTMIGGALLSISGLALLFAQGGFFARTLALVNILGLRLPAELTPAQEMHYAALWHSIVALVLICVVIAHSYARTIGIQGAFSAMGSGQVDANWARQHHNLWAEHELRKLDEAAALDNAVAPAE